MIINTITLKQQLKNKYANTHLYKIIINLPDVTHYDLVAESYCGARLEFSEDDISYFIDDELQYKSRRYKNIRTYCNFNIESIIKSIFKQMSTVIIDKTLIVKKYNRDLDGNIIADKLVYKFTYNAKLIYLLSPQIISDMTNINIAVKYDIEASGYVLNDEAKAVLLSYRCKMICNYDSFTYDCKTIQDYLATVVFLQLLASGSCHSGYTDSERLLHSEYASKYFHDNLPNLQVIVNKADPIDCDLSEYKYYYNCDKEIKANQLFRQLCVPNRTKSARN